MSAVASEIATLPAAGGVSPVAGDVLCFGQEDWWYHNRGHCDFQFMRQFARSGRVLYVNSIVMRKLNLGEGAMFWKRVRRKLGSMTRGLVQVDERFWVYSPVTAPVHHLPLAGAFNQAFLRMQVRLAMARLGFGRPLVWVGSTAACDTALRLANRGMIYQRTDRHEAYPGVDVPTIVRLDQRLKQAADVTLYSSRSLLEQEAGQCRQAVYIDHGVDYEKFAEAAAGHQRPLEVAGLPRPLIGFFGGIDHHTFDLDLMAAVVRRLPDLHFVFVGKASLDPAPLTSCPNVTMIGQQPYERIPLFGAAFDVCLMPWNQNEWIAACNPIKLKEYLALGKPVVSRPFPELEPYRAHVEVAVTPEEFAAAIRRALAEDSPGRQAARQQRVRAQGWDAKAASLLATLAGGPVDVREEAAAVPALAGRL